MANIFNTADYILSETGPMHINKLQHLCYYTQAWSLAWGDGPLFPEDFVAMRTYGPICPALNDIEREAGKVYSVPKERCSELTDEQKLTIEKVLDYYADRDSHWLTTLTMMEDPWRKAGEGNIITKKSMEEYYASL